ncbi:MAG: redox-sensing transcriptional repressor Rex [Pirellulaceae bacterium]
MSDGANSNSGKTSDSVPQAVVNRLSLYLRELQHLLRDGHETTSSTQLGKLLGFTDAQVRKDLAYFGQFGYPGIGYKCEELVTAIRRILGTDRDWPIGLVGVGNLGRALLGYRGFSTQGFRLVAAFDEDQNKVSKNINGIPIFHISDLKTVARQMHLKLGIVAVPGPAAQAVADDLVEAGVEGIMNFAPVTISLPDTVRLVAVDLAIELEQLSFAVVNRTAKE